MKFVLLAVVLLLGACDKPSVPKIAAPQREALDKAKAVDQVVQDATDASKKQIEDAGK
ncbi:MAG: hypothetical protein WBM09_07155 [Gallionella sp.]